MSDRNSRRIAELVRIPDNSACADCGQQSKQSKLKLRYSLWLGNFSYIIPGNSVVHLGCKKLTSFVN